MECKLISHLQVFEDVDGGQVVMGSGAACG